MFRDAAATACRRRTGEWIAMRSGNVNVRQIRRIVVVFVGLTLGAVVLTLISAYWRHVGAPALGYLGGGMFAAALTYLLVETSTVTRSMSGRH
jgi:hypothetical protein